VLEVALHTDGRKLLFNGHTHEQFVHLFHAIGEDHHNRVVILTGSGDAFMDAISPEGFDFFSPQGYDKILHEGRKVLSNILDIESPMIAALNGPVLLHSEYALLTDIILATPETVFQDKPHFDFGIVPGDGVNLLWPEVIGSIRGRYFILTRQVLDAQTAKAWRVVNEMVPADRLLARAHEVADTIAALPPASAPPTWRAAQPKTSEPARREASRWGDSNIAGAECRVSRDRQARARPANFFDWASVASSWSGDH
jgi:enoyl-CoA hydratase/carnithine racemase